MLFIFFIFFTGLILGSFISAVSYRLPRQIPFVSGRSFCPNCRHKINWYDNIPLFSFFFLGGRCRNCKKKISWRYPLIEFFTAIGFVLIYLFLGQGRTLPILVLGKMGVLAFPYLLFVFCLLELIFIIDLEHKIIFDDLTFFLFFVFVSTSLLFSDERFFINLLSAFSISFSLLVLHLLTLGKGMGLGDVKLAIPLGFFLGFPLGLVWIFVSFLTGAIVGIILILVGKAKFGKQIPFGPFLIFSFWLVLFFGEKVIFFLR